MKAIITTVALTSALFAGAVSAASVQQSQLGAGIAFKTTSHYVAVEKVEVNTANLKSNAGIADLYIGSK